MFFVNLSLQSASTIIVMSSSKHNYGQLQNVKQPKNVKVLILSESKTNIKEFYYIKGYINLIKIDLSYNKLTSFPPGFTLHVFHSLRTLFLHYNKFNSIKNLAPILSCKTLVYLTLFGNPLQEAKTRHFIVNQMPSLMLMDNKLVKLQERDQIVNTVYVQADPVPFPLVRHQSQEDTEQYLQNMIKELRIVRQKYVEVNPIIRIQRWWRHLYRLKHCKWKVTKLPEQTCKNSTVYDLKHYKQNLDRLITEKIQMSKSNEEKIMSLFEGNSSFWKVIKQLIRSGVYFTRQYCQQSCIRFTQVERLRVFRYKSQTNVQKSNKTRILFILQKHKQIVASFLQKKRRMNGLVVLSHSKKISKIEYNVANYQATSSKLQKLQQRYKQFVQPSLSESEILEIIRKQYFKIIALQLKGSQKQSFPVLIKQLLNRSISAVTIQRIWKGYKVRKIINTSKSIKTVKAAIKIQKWVRNLPFLRRFKFLLEVGLYLKKQKESAQIVLELGQITAIEWYCKLKDKGINFVVPFQQCSFTVQKAAYSHNLNVFKCKIVYNSERKPYPDYMKLNFANQKQNNEQQSSFNVLEILFKGAKTVKTILDSKGVKQLQITYHSIEETLDRKFILALKTYRMQNHQFVKSNTLPSGPIQTTTNLLQILSTNKMISIQTDSLILNKRELQVKPLINQRSYQSLVSDVQLNDGSIQMRVRFYLATFNYSCFLVIKSPNFDCHSVASIINLSVSNKYYLGRKRFISKRYQDSSNQNLSKISRNIISLDEGLGNHDEKKKNLQYTKILSTDQSHSIIVPLSHQNSLEHLQGEHKFLTYDKFNKEVYPPATQVVRQSLRYKKQLDEIQQLRHKKSVIDEIKQSHRQKIRDILLKKSKNLSSLRGKYNKQEDQNAQKIEKARIELQQRKIKKHQLIKETKINSDKFELQFMKKGIKSINKEAKVQKICASFREQKRDLNNHIRKKKNNLIQKNQIKQFSIKVTDGDLSLKASENGKIKSENQKDNKYHSIMASKSHAASIRLKSESCQVSRDQQEQKIREQAKALKLQKQLKRARKKRLVHSVFPEQFYPLKQSHQIGFELPRILKK